MSRRRAEGLDCQGRQRAEALQGKPPLTLSAGPPPSSIAIQQKATERSQFSALEADVKTAFMNPMASLDSSALEESSGETSPAGGSSLTSGCNEFDLSPLFTLGLSDTLYGSDVISYAQALQIDGPAESNVASEGVSQRVIEESSKTSPGVWIDGKTVAPEASIFTVTDYEVETSSPDSPGDEGLGMWASSPVYGFPGFAPFPLFSTEGEPALGPSTLNVFE